PTPAVCPPTETTGDINTQSVTQGTIADPANFASTTPNRINFTISGGVNPTAKNFGDHAATPFLSCPSDAFLYQQSPSNLYGVNLVSGGSFVLRDDWTITTNAVGFNLLDDYLYGFVSGSNGYISRTDGNGDITIHKVEGLGKVNAYTGDVSVDGYLYLNRGRKELWIVDVNAQRPTYLQLVNTITLSSNSNIADWAFNAVDGMLYGVRGNGDLVQVNPTTGALTVIGDSGIVEGGAFGAVYFDVDGYFYASNNGTGKIYRFDLRDSNNLNPTATLFTQGPKSSTNDGARCVFAPVAKLDFGDAPDSYGTTLNANGARHIITVGLLMGTLIDSEDDGQPTAGADGDDTTDDADEDGLVAPFAPLPPGATTYSVQVNAVNSTGSDAYLVGYLDWNNDGDFDDADEQSATV
ncbi:MAG: hypothetical protein KDD78_21450, partial [Caldilineaceae bacterium]|nr:hypothetical protein [Caldilineaceae bacterium]